MRSLRFLIAALSMTDSDFYNLGAVALFEFFAGAAEAGFVAAELFGHAGHLGQRTANRGSGLLVGQLQFFARQRIQPVKDRRSLRIGYGVRREVGMLVCSGKKSDSKPRASTALASSSGRIA